MGGDAFPSSFGVVLLSVLAWCCLFLSVSGGAAFSPFFFECNEIKTEGQAQGQAQAQAQGEVEVKLRSVKGM